MTQLHALQENTRNQFRAILSREQRQQYDDLLQRQESRQNAAQASEKTAR
jgi:Spy/CpxP family protein refolding chaperone